MPRRAAASERNAQTPEARAGGWLLGLCCTFLDQPIRFRRTTARYVKTLSPARRQSFLEQIAFDNATALNAALRWCAANGVGAFRVNSEILPLLTHPEVGYSFASLDQTGRLRAAFRDVGDLRRRTGLRLSFHPDQFVVPGSATPAVARMAIRELEYQAEIAELVGAEQLTIHGGGAQGGKVEALRRLARAFEQVSARVRRRLVLENDDRVYAPSDLLPLCRGAGIPLVYDVHHHRCLPDAMDVDEAFQAAAETWHGREPWVHISSPLGGWRAADPRRHADYVKPNDIPRCWLGQRLTVDVEAKAKELAVLRLRRWLEQRSAT